MKYAQPCNQPLPASTSSSHSMVAAPQTPNLAPHCRARLFNQDQALTGLLRAHPFQYISSALYPVAGRPPFSTVRPVSSQAAQTMSTHVANTTQAAGPALHQQVLWLFLLFTLFPSKNMLQESPVHSSVLYTVTMQQPAVHVQGQGPWTASMLASVPHQEQRQKSGEQLLF